MLSCVLFTAAAQQINPPSGVKHSLQTGNDPWRFCSSLLYGRPPPSCSRHTAPEMSGIAPPAASKTVRTSLQHLPAVYCMMWLSFTVHWIAANLSLVPCYPRQPILPCCCCVSLQRSIIGTAGFLSGLRATHCPCLRYGCRPSSHRLSMGYLITACGVVGAQQPSSM